MEYCKQSKIALYSEFQKCVNIEFAFLKQMRFAQNVTVESAVNFISPKVFLQVHFERISYEIYSAITSRSSNISLTIDEIITDKYKRQYFAATTNETILKCVSENAMLIRQFANSLLLGDEAEFQRVANSTEEKRTQLLLDEKILRFEEKAYSEWKQKNYQGVIDNYSSILEYLTPTQQKRYNLCLKYLN